MTHSRNIALAYCIDNLNVAEAITNTLSDTPYRFEHFYCKKDESAAPLAQQLEDFTGTIILLISDNFLRSLHCMQGSLQLLQQKNEQILPLVVDGRRYDDLKGTVDIIPTRFEKIGDIIPYINYWQNQYLDLRSQRRRLEGEEDYDREVLGAHIRNLRQVSSEASEFLRVLRNTPHYPLSEFSEDHFRLLFEAMEEEESWESFKNNHPQPQLQLETESRDMPEEQEDETKDLLHSKQEDQVEDPIVEQTLNKIPGMEMLEGRENIAKIIGGRLGEKVDFNQFKKEAAESESITEHTLQDQIIEEEIEEPAEEEQEEIGTISTPNESAFPEEEKKLPANEAGSFFESPEHLSDPSVSETNLELERPNDQQPADPLERANELLADGRVQEGLMLLQEGIHQQPERNDLRYQYALHLAQNGSNIDQAMEELEVVLSNDPGHVDAQFLMGELAELKGDFSKAAANYQKVADLDETFPDIYYRLGILHVANLEDFEQAAKYFKKAVKHKPEHVDAQYQYGLLLGEQLKKPNKAIDAFEKTLELQYNHPFANYDLALLFHQKGEFKRARRYYQRAIEINPELKTPENDAAFFEAPNAEVKKAELPSSAETAPQPSTLTSQLTVEEEGGTEASMLASLKRNISRLEELLIERKAEVKKKEMPTVDQTVLVSGATSGIGRAIAAIFAEKGYRVIITGRRQDRLEALQQEWREAFGAEVLPLQFDVREAETVKQAVIDLPEPWQKVDLLINNAGKARGLAPIHEGELDHWEEMIDTNLKGLLYLTRAVAPGMVKRQSGHIINVGSIAGKEVYPQGNVYCATKFAVDALTKAMRMDLHKYNIRVSQVSPGHVEETEFALVRFDGDEERAKIYEDFQPVTSKDVAEIIYFMATRPAHVNIQDTLVMGTQQASATIIDRSGRA